MRSVSTRTDNEQKQEDADHVRYFLFWCILCAIEHASCSPAPCRTLVSPRGGEVGRGQRYNLSDVRSGQLPGKDARRRFTGADRMFNRARTRWLLHQNTSTGFKNHLLSSRAATSPGPAEAMHCTQTLYTPVHAHTHKPHSCVFRPNYSKRGRQKWGMQGQAACKIIRLQRHIESHSQFSPSPFDTLTTIPD